jgi:hypothetical protein
MLFALLLGGAGIYIVIGIGLLALYPNIESNELSQLPQEGWVCPSRHSLARSLWSAL